MDNICSAGMIEVPERPDNVGCGNCGKKLERLDELICSRCGYEVDRNHVTEMSLDEVIEFSKSYKYRRYDNG